MGREDCHCSESKVPRIQAFNSSQQGQILSGDHRSTNATYINFDNFPERKCVDYEQDPETGTVFIIKKSGTYKLNFGGIFTLTNERPPQNLPEVVPFDCGATVLVNTITPPVFTSPDGEFNYLSINPVVNQGQINAFITGVYTITQNRSYLLHLNKGDKLRYIAGGTNEDNIFVTLNNSNLSLERLP